METVISQHRLDIDVLRSSRLSLGSGPQMGDSGQRQTDNNAPGSSAGVDMPQTGTAVGTWHAVQSSEAKDEAYSGTAQNFMLSEDCKAAAGASDPGKHEGASLDRPPKVDSLRHDIINQGSVSQSQRSSKSLEHESPASVPMEDSRSANSQERHNSTKSDAQAGRKDAKKTNTKRKRAESKESSDAHGDDPQQSDSVSTRFNSRKGKHTGRGVAQSHPSVKGGERSHLGSVQQSVPMEEVSPLLETGLLKSRQESSFALMENKVDKFKKLNPSSASRTSKYLEEEVSSSHPSSGAHKGYMPQSRVMTLGSMGLWNQSRVVSPSEVSQGFVTGLADPLGLDMNINTQRAENNGLNINTAEDADRVNGGISTAFSSNGVFKEGFSNPLQSTSSGHDLGMMIRKDRNPDVPTGSAIHSIEKGKKVLGTNVEMNYPSRDCVSSKEAAEFESGRHGFVDVPQPPEKAMDVHLSSSRGSAASGYVYSGRILGHEGGSSHTTFNPYTIFQVFAFFFRCCSIFNQQIA